jgi:integrase
VNRRLKVFRIVLNYAIDNELIDKDPTRRIEFLPHIARKGRVVTLEEEARLLAEVKTPAERAQLLLALDAGLRWGEVAGLPVDAIVGDYVEVRQVLDRDTRTIRPFPKGKVARLVPVATARLAAALAEAVELAEEAGSDLLFTAATGRPLDPWNWRRDVWRGLTHRARVNKRGDRLRFHDLRHTLATRLADANVPTKDIAEILGHADESTTRIYTHAADDAHRLDLMRSAFVRAA